MDLGIALGIVGTTIGAISFIIAIPPFTQMMWGRPSLVMAFEESHEPKGKVLLCSIHNKKVDSHILKWLGVIRESANVQAFFDIQEQGTNKFIAKDISGMISNHVRERGLSVRVMPAFHASFIIVHCTDNGPVFSDARKNEVLPIPQGDYIADVTIVSSDRFYKVQKSFKAHKESGRTFWC